MWALMACLWGEGRGRLTFQSSSFHQLGLFRRESRYEMFRKRVMLGVLAEALMKWMAASRSTANVYVVDVPVSLCLISFYLSLYWLFREKGAHTRSAPPLPPAPALQKT